MGGPPVNDDKLTERMRTHSAQIITELETAIMAAEAGYLDSHQTAYNSYGAGYDRGWYDGLLHARSILLGEDDGGP